MIKSLQPNMCNKNVMLEGEDEMLVGKFWLATYTYCLHIISKTKYTDQVLRLTSCNTINICFFQEIHVSPIRHTTIPYIEQRPYIPSMDFGHVSGLGNAYNKNILSSFTIFSLTST